MKNYPRIRWIYLKPHFRTGETSTKQEQYINLGFYPYIDVC